MSHAAPQSSPAGWYGDPYVQDSMRYFDGMSWTAHVSSAAAPAPAQPGFGADPKDPVHWILPTGRTWQSVVAGYVALFAIVAWFLGPVALGLGIWGLKASQKGGAHGRGRAVFAIVVGALSSVAALAFIVMSIT